MEKMISNIKIELIKGDIVQQPDCDAIVNAANAELRIGGGVAGAVHRAGDPELEHETRPLAPIRPGDAVITSAPGLPNKYIIHCLGPVYGRDTPSDRLLSDCYKNALGLAEDNQIVSIAFPALSTGAFGYPVKEAAEVAFDAISNKANTLQTVKLIRFVLWDEQSVKVHKEVLEGI